MQEKGLTSEEVKQRVGQGLANNKEENQSRGYLEILAKNLLTPFNIVLFILGIALLYFEEHNSAIAATGVIIFNVLISTLQEWKAKRRLDKIAVLMRPKVSALRDGELKIIDRSEIVMDDILHMGPGDQAQVDCDILEEKSLEMDESLLTGESHTIRKHAGDKVYSGSYCVTGECWVKVTEVGDATYSAKMLSRARKFNKKVTPLQTETNTVTQVLMVIAFVFLAALVVLNFLMGHGLRSYLKEAVIVLDIVPIALFLLISLTYMIAAVRMADSGVLLQNSNSVESMSHVDTVCMDKTGTITTNNLIFEGIDCMGNDPETTERLVRLFISSTGSRNRTITALEQRFGGGEFELLDAIQFSSERKVSAVRVRSGQEVHTIVMG
ncbi:MAG: HAD-IC family P-type ATPase, partial [archaeon]|nr:HAD-IC family P-type ATPase [archaeon]